MVKLAEGVGNAPTSVETDPVFGTGAANFYLPAFQNGARGRNPTLIFDVRTIALCGLSYASKVSPGRTGNCSRPLLRPCEVSAGGQFPPG